MGAAGNCLAAAGDRLSEAMRSRGLLPIFALILLFSGSLWGDEQERCGVGKDYMVQALEQIKTGAREEVENGLQLLKHANEQCTSLGDAWYYRSLFERKLGHAPLADYSLKKAQMFGSEAMEQKADPFSLAAPQCRAKRPPRRCMTNGRW